VADQREFLKLFLADQAELQLFVRSLVRDRQDCDDICQSVALVLWAKFDQYDASRSFAAWARGIAAIEVQRQRSRRTPMPFSPEAVTAIVDAFDRRESENTSDEMEALRDCVAGLPEEDQQMLGYRYSQQLSADEIAEQMDRTSAAVHKSLWRLRTRLLECVQRRIQGKEGIQGGRDEA
jgi:RNA polymerase sigma-70 factor (ECF subfamily)